MSADFEKELGIISVEEAIDTYEDMFPQARLSKLQLEYEGPFLKYDCVGYDQKQRHSIDFNAKTKAVLKKKSKDLKGKKSQKEWQDRKILNVDQLLDLGEVNAIALDHAPVDQPFQWELDRKKDRTLWKIELANAEGDQIYEVKVDAQDGTVTQVKLKS